MIESKKEMKPIVSNLYLGRLLIESWMVITF